MSALNFHHLRYFWTIARERSLTRAAERLHVSQSALSIQLAQLEQRLGVRLFDRRNRQLHLTEAGRIALQHSEVIFSAGEELLATLRGAPQSERRVLRIGAVATMSRNFQLKLLRPLLGQESLSLVLHSGSLRELLAQLEAHAVDIVLSTRPVARDPTRAIYSHLLEKQPVSVVGPTGGTRLRFPRDLDGLRLLAPSLQTEMRADFDALCERLGIRPRIVAEVDDMAMLRLLAREQGVCALVPLVVVQDELRSRQLVERCRVPGLTESYYAITPERRFPNVSAREALGRWVELQQAPPARPAARAPKPRGERGRPARERTRTRG